MDDWTTGQWIGMAGGVAGAVIGLVGAVIGTYVSLKRAGGPRERAFVIRCAVACFLLIAAFLIGFSLTPHPYRHWVIIPYIMLLGACISWANRRQAAIQVEEARRDAGHKH
jgi:hypothetical protein